MSALQTGVIALCALAALLASVRHLRPRRPHRLLLAALQWPLAALLAMALLSPLPQPEGTLVVLARGATDAQMKQLAQGDARVVALPEAGDITRHERVPDLATARRRHPGITDLRIVGAGLGPRDLDAARGLPVAFDAAPLRAGVVALDAPSTVSQGRAFRVAGRVNGVKDGTVELRDPSDAAVARAGLDAAGDFSLEAHAQVPGFATYRLLVLDTEGTERDAAPIPLDVRASAPLRIGVLAGGPSPELKYLRRYVRDAGFELRSRLALAPGIEMVDAPLALDAASLRELDLLVADDRGWGGASRAERDVITAEVREGLGLVLRATGPIATNVAEDWRGLGVALEAATEPEATRATPGPGDVPALALAPLAASSPELAPIHIGNAAVAWWRPEQRGRVALWRVLDSHRLVTSGHSRVHGEAWASLVATLARARGTADVALRDRAYVDRRAVLCGAVDGATVRAPDGTVTALVPRPERGETCAAWWPRGAGWHAVAGRDGTTGAVYAHEPAQGPLLDAADARATLALPGVTRAAAVATMSWRLPLLAAWFALLAVAWMIERRALRLAAASG